MFFCWLLKAVAYDLVNANEKWQTRSDGLLLSLGLSRVPIIPQLLFREKNGNLFVLVAKIVDNLLITRTSEAVKKTY